MSVIFRSNDRREGCAAVSGVLRVACDLTGGISREEMMGRGRVDRAKEKERSTQDGSMVKGGVGQGIRDKIQSSLVALVPTTTERKRHQA